MSEFDFDAEAIEALASFKEKELSPYEDEKLMGIRNANGSMKLKELGPKHERVIEMFLLGRSHKEISKETEYSVPHISLIVNDPLARGVIERVSQHWEDELKAMKPLVLNVLRKGLLHDSIKIGLSAVDRYAKMTGAEEDKGGGQFNFNIIIDARQKFIDGIKAIAMDAKVIDAEFKEE